jgi:diguanylate cyclase (GGDEF)-like protein
MEKTEDIATQLALAEQRAEAAERRLEVAKKELLKLSTDSSPEDLARSRVTIKLLTEERESLAQENAALYEKLGGLAQDVARFRTSYLSGELDNSILRERITEAEDRLATVVKPLPENDQRLVRERALSWMALQDPMTKLANGNRVDIQLEEAVRTAGDAMIVLMLLDIDHFHTVNEVGGWKAGNALLLEVGQRMGKLIEGTDTFLARRGEDEFAVIFSVPRPEGSQLFDTPLIRVRQLADLILQVFDTPFDLAGQRVPVTASMGVAVYPNDSDTGQELLENAHVALASSKATKRGSYLFFNDKLYLEREDRAGLATELAKVIEQEKLLFVYRPVVGVARGTQAYAQVEAYWEHPSHGRVAQGDFMAIAESLGLAHKVADQCLQAGLALSRKVKGSIPVLISFPASMMGRAEIVKHILDQVAKARTRPESLAIDLPAECFERWPRETRTFLEELARWRVGRSISGVGSGSIPLRELQATRPEMVGLSQEITRQTPQIESQTALTKGMLGLLRGLGMATRVEGVGDKSQAHFLALHECDYVCGDFLSPATGLDDFLARKRSTWTLR